MFRSIEYTLGDRMNGIRARPLRSLALQRVEVAADRNGRDQSQTTCEGRIEITLENGCRISIRDDVDAGFVLELARGLAA